MLLKNSNLQSFSSLGKSILPDLQYNLYGLELITRDLTFWFSENSFEPINAVCLIPGYFFLYSTALSAAPFAEYICSTFVSGNLESGLDPNPIYTFVL